MTKYRPKEPELTPGRIAFNEHVVAVAQKMSNMILARVNEQFGRSSDEEVNSWIRFNALTDIHFGKSHDSSSRILSGSIAGSDSFSIQNIISPIESWIKSEPQADYPARILRLILNYEGAEGTNRSTSMDLFSGDDFAQIMIKSEAVGNQYHGIDHHPEGVSDLWKYIDHLPGSAFYYPDEQELSAIQEGLTVIEDDISLAYFMRECYEGHAEMSADDEGAQPGIDWLRSCYTQLIDQV